MEKWLSGRARSGVAGGSESRWRPGASPEAQGKGHWQQVEGGGPSPLLCPALGCPGQDRHGQTGENPPRTAPPTAPPTVRWARNLAQLEPTATRDSRTELCWHAAALRGGRLCPTALPRHRHQHPASPHPRCRRLRRILAVRRGSSCPGRDGPGQLLLRLQVGSPRGSGTRGHARAPHQTPFSCPPLSALQGGSHRRRAGAERGRAADPGPQEEREAPSPPPGGTGRRQVAVRPSQPSCLAPSPGPGTSTGTPRHRAPAPPPCCSMHQPPSQRQAGDRALPAGTPRRPPPAPCLPLFSADGATACAHSSAWPWTGCGC